jgi:DNA/RNA endonuclease YhcR with UshA esterase domain
VKNQPSYSSFRLAALAVVLAGTLFPLATLRAADDSATSQPTSAPVLVNATDKDAVTAAMGKDVLLEGTIESAAWSSSGKVMKATFKDSSKVSIVLFEKKKTDFDNAFAGDVVKALVGARVRVSGKLKDFKGSPEVALDQVSQITILDAAPSSQPSDQSGR